jgi:hypothetical protein
MLEGDPAVKEWWVGEIIRNYLELFGIIWNY